jgi:hypothetical protein
LNTGGTHSAVAVVARRARPKLAGVDSMGYPFQMTAADPPKLGALLRTLSAWNAGESVEVVGYGNFAAAIGAGIAGLST